MPISFLALGRYACGSAADIVDRSTVLLTRVDERESKAVILWVERQD